MMFVRCDPCADVFVGAINRPLELIDSIFKNKKIWLPAWATIFFIFIMKSCDYSMTAANPPFFTILISMVLFFVTFCSILL